MASGLACLLGLEGSIDNSSNAALLICCHLCKASSLLCNAVGFLLFAFWCLCLLASTDSHVVHEIKEAIIDIVNLEPHRP